MRLGLLAVLLVLPLAAAAQVYRWVDEKGKVHYTQTPPPKGSYQEVPPAPPPGAMGGSPSLGEYANKLQNDRLQRESSQAQASQDKARREQACSSARRRQAFLQRYDGRISSMDDEGGRGEAWSAERYTQENARVQAAISENCQ